MDQIQDMIDKLGLNNQITLEEIPQIDLYMDQVIQLFENKFSNSKRNEDEKVLTKTMINNYAKGKLFFPIKNKKYSKEHLILISLIYQLKGVLSINDIKETLFKINEKTSMNQFHLDGFYESYLHVASKNIENFNEDIVAKSIVVKNEIDLLEDPEKEDLQKILMIASLANMSNLYRRAAEKLVDELAIVQKKKEK
ncbi:DUF1836 domain-containing protein [Cytobacillus solani]|uniref:Cytoplasmic protein n=1 Tax=Cytobacillus solani TaxID=1637975 RepID=A0A0Q3VHK1_9BACI|nr:DUF1836 domain-containing protein [Cytobacillus solani]KOP82774.1 hypothetical protein AMS60_09985 [Bacillus sp. FJAT-21945]KQL19794.1 hypothetical protein AN957_15295 [Cytobacillus solani]USK53027.1 DUF1836 domain-containing protein [Cytobacillus solani]